MLQHVQVNYNLQKTKATEEINSISQSHWFVAGAVGLLLVGASDSCLLSRLKGGIRQSNM